jgi:hypothetical protein
MQIPSWVSVHSVGTLLLPVWWERVGAQGSYDSGFCERPPNLKTLATGKGILSTLLGTDPDLGH